jgi:excisionase family DNA binding protein
MDKEQLLTVDQLASFLQVCPETVRRYVRSGDIKAVKLGRALRFSREQIEDFINRFAEKDLGEEPKEEDDDVDEQDSHDADEENLDYDNI